MLLKQYAAENEDMRQCVLQFDQTIAQKADRWNITELKTQIQKDYLAIKDFDSRAKFIDNLRQQVEESINNTTHRIDHFESKLSQIVKKIVGQDISQRMVQYD